jgi:hypothetical protein
MAVFVKEHVAHSLAVPVGNSEVSQIRSCTARLITQQHGDVCLEFFVRHDYLPAARGGDSIFSLQRLLRNYSYGS